MSSTSNRRKKIYLIRNTCGWKYRSFYTYFINWPQRCKGHYLPGRWRCTLEDFHNDERRLKTRTCHRQSDNLFRSDMLPNCVLIDYDFKHSSLHMATYLTRSPREHFMCTFFTKQLDQKLVDQVIRRNNFFITNFAVWKCRKKLACLEAPLRW